MVCHRFGPFHLVPSSLAPTDVFLSFLSGASVFMSRHPQPFFSLARTFARALVCTHTRTRILLETRCRYPRFVTMRFGSSVVPLHLVPLRRQLHTLEILCTELNAVPHAGLGFHFLRVPVRTLGAWGSGRGSEAKSVRSKATNRSK